MSSINTSSRGFRNIWRRYAPYARSDAGYISLAIVAVIGIATTNTAMIWLIGTPFDLLHAGEFRVVWQALWLFAGIVSINLLMHFIAIALTEMVGLRFVGRVRSDLFQHMLHRSIPHMNSYSRGDLLTRLGNDVDRIQNMILQLPIHIVSHCLTIIFYSCMLFWIDWQLAILAIAITPAFIIHQRIFAPLNRRYGEHFFARNGELIGFEENTLNNLQGVSSFGIEKQMTRLQRLKYAVASRWRVKSAWAAAGFNVTFSLLIYLTGIVVIYAGIYGIQEENLTTGQLVSFLLYLGYLSFPIREIAQLGFQAQEDIAAANRVNEILDNIDNTTEPTQTLSVSMGAIEFKDVSFAYPDYPPLFQGLNLSIAPGETIALVGPSGSGKSTLAKLLMGFYTPQNGSIYIDGQNIHHVSRTSLRQSIAVVWQEPFLVQDTIRANLLLARSNASVEEVNEACKAAGAWDFINQLEKGLDTNLGPGGAELSVGQQQRLSIARTFLCNAPLLLLDEPTSALDSQAEQQLVLSLDQLRQGHTTLIIAHRFSSIRKADRVVYFHGDGTATMASHTELLASCEGYRQAVEWQLSATK